jgi:hypothetical protein
LSNGQKLRTITSCPQNITENADSTYDRGAVFLVPFTTDTQKVGHFAEMYYSERQGRNQGKRQSVSEYILSSLKNKNHIVKYKFFLIQTFYLFESDILYRSFLIPPLANVNSDPGDILTCIHVSVSNRNFPMIQNNTKRAWLDLINGFLAIFSFQFVSIII